MFGNLRGSEWLILILVIVLLFGARRLPDAARGLGRSLRIFKAETKGLTDQDQPADPKAVDAVDPATPPPAAQQAPTPSDTKPTQT
ncbi:MAG: Sec-independent protein translocase subunit TatA [Candidatus Nanopelagicales bacterium]